ncbi:MAG: fimbrillin family protein [Prevotellaceae bacterium]|nr:fimbrillin family protein [Prevotellaceae bacterium]
MKKTTINPSRASRRLLYITMLVMAVAMMFSCSGDDEGDGKQRQIFFSSSLSSEKSKTRAAGEELKPLYEIGINQFKVYGFKKPASGNLQTVFNNEPVNYTDVRWGYEMPRYWDQSAQEYMFFGYNPGVGDVTSLGTTVSAEIIDNTVTYKCGSIPYIIEKSDGTLWTKDPTLSNNVEHPYHEIGQKDIPYISHIWRNSPTPDHSVDLTFFAPYAQVSVAFSRVASVDPTETTIKAIQFKPLNPTHAIYDHPDLTYTYNIGGTDYGKESFKIDRREDHMLILGNGFTYDNMTKIQRIGDVDTEVGILDNPETVYMSYPIYWTFPTYANELGEFELSASIGGEPQTCTVPAEYTQWDMGYHYIYVFRITREGIDRVSVIKVGIKEWENIGESSPTFYNW